MFACIYIPDFPVEAVVRAEPELRERAVAILEGVPPLATVVALNERARQAGVEPGMTALQIEGLGELAARRRSCAQEAAAHAALLDGACAFSPRVEDTAPGTVLLELTGLERLFGPFPKIARDLARRVSEIGLESNVAVASNPDAALHAARGFSGVTVIAAGQEAERLGPLPADLLAPTLEVLATLDRWGVRTFHAFAVLPEVAVAERLGQAGVKLQRLARGAVRRALVPIEPPLVFEEAVDLEHPIELLEPLAFVLNRMLEQLCSRLQSRSLATNELRLRLALDGVQDVEEEDPPRDHRSTEEKEEGKKTFVLPCFRGERTAGRAFERTLKLPVPMQDAKVFLKLLQLDLKAHPPDAPVRQAWLAAEPVKPRSAQAGLFLPASPEPERLEITLARLAGIVGEGRVGAAEVLDTHRPDAHRMARFEVAAAELSRPAAGEAQPALALRLFRPALRAHVELSGGRPVRLAFDGKRLQVISASGPWRTSGEWWTDDAAAAPGGEKSPGWDRDEWDVSALAPPAEPASGLAPVSERIVLFRIHFDRRTETWFVEGAYD